MDDHNHEKEYFWSKNIRPSFEKDVDRNTATNYIMRHLKTEGAILKTIHIAPNTDTSTKSDDVDLTPFVKYSVNKRRRWEAKSLDKLDLLRHLSAIHQNSELVLLDRVNLFSAFNSFYHHYQFPIRQLHQLHTSDDKYQHICINSILGQPFKNFQSNENKEDKIVAYHFITPPKSYENLLKNQFCPGSSSDRYWGSRTLAHERRHLNKAETMMELRYDEFDILGGGEIENVTEECEKDDVDENELPRQFYNLEDHIVDKFDFVFVKRRKCGRKMKKIK
uniref:Uncharacterized protein n=1 Tax=Caenorhabditis japonica TaxID=281687 RepID=A0A8R1I9G9_CAEJA